MKSVAEETAGLLAELGIQGDRLAGGQLAVKTPITGEVIGQVAITDTAKVQEAIEAAHSAFLEWRKVPAPQRGELVRLLGEELRAP